MSECLKIQEVYVSKLIEIDLLEKGLVIVKGNSHVYIQNSEDLKALKRFVDKLVEGE